MSSSIDSGVGGGHGGKNKQVKVVRRHLVGNHDPYIPPTLPKQTSSLHNFFATTPTKKHKSCPYCMPCSKVVVYQMSCATKESITNSDLLRKRLLRTKLYQHIPLIFEVCNKTMRDSLFMEQPKAVQRKEKNKADVFLAHNMELTRHAFMPSPPSVLDHLNSRTSLDTPAPDEATPPPSPPPTNADASSGGIPPLPSALSLPLGWKPGDVLLKNHTADLPTTLMPGRNPSA